MTPNSNYFGGLDFLEWNSLSYIGRLTLDISKDNFTTIVSSRSRSRILLWDYYWLELIKKKVEGRESDCHSVFLWPTPDIWLTTPKVLDTQTSISESWSQMMIVFTIKTWVRYRNFRKACVIITRAEDAKGVRMKLNVLYFQG